MKRSCGGGRAGTSLRALEVFRRDEKTACHTRIAPASGRISLVLLAAASQQQLWLLAGGGVGGWGLGGGARGVTGSHSQGFLSLSLSPSHSTSGQQANAHVTVSRKKALGTVELLMETSDVTFDLI